MKFKLIILTILVGFTTFAQKEYKHKGTYVSLGYQIGFLSVDLENNNYYSFEKIENKTNLSHSGVVSGIYKTPFNAEIKLGYLYSYNNLPFEGITHQRNFKVSNNYYSHTIFLGAGYNIPINDNFDFTIGLGSAISLIKNENLSEDEGNTTDKILVTNNSVRKGNAFIIPELSVTKYLNNGDFISFGGKYYYSANDLFLEGKIQNISTVHGLKYADYKTTNNYFGIYLAYGIKVKKNKKNRKF